MGQLEAEVAELNHSLAGKQEEVDLLEQEGEMREKRVVKVGQGRGEGL